MFEQALIVVMAELREYEDNEGNARAKLNNI